MLLQNISWLLTRLNGVISQKAEFITAAVRTSDPRQVVNVRSTEKIPTYLIGYYRFKYKIAYSHNCK
jgi:hypothetical protein